MNEVNITGVGIGRGILGVCFLIALAWVFSTNRKKINWKLVFIGLGLQILLAISFLHIPTITTFFEGVGGVFIQILGFTEEGVVFLLGPSLGKSSGNMGFVFAFHVLPTIVFFSAFTSLLYYFGILQRIVYSIAWVMKKTMRLSGAESLAAAANVFIGQTEAPLVVKPYLGLMTKSEIMS